MKTINDHLKNIKHIQKETKKQYRIEKVLCWLGFHKDWYKSGKGIMHVGECIYCKKQY